jgi:hypothetical protein
MNYRIVLVLTLLPGTVGRAEQFVFIDEEITWTAGAYDYPVMHGPSDWTSPIDYVHGTVYARYECIHKPSDKNVAVQLCMWQSGYKKESCAPCRNYSNEDIYYFDWGTPEKNWWKKPGGALDYTNPFQCAYVMHKDGSCGARLLMNSACGAACYTGTDLKQHVPITFHLTVIVVAQGDTLVSPDDWDCPASWNCKNETTGIVNRDLTHQNAITRVHANSSGYGTGFFNCTSVKTIGLFSFTGRRIEQDRMSSTAVFIRKK